MPASNVPPHAASPPWSSACAAAISLDCSEISRASVIWAPIADALSESCCPAADGRSRSALVHGRQAPASRAPTSKSLTTDRRSPASPCCAALERLDPAHHMSRSSMTLHGSRTVAGKAAFETNQRRLNLSGEYLCFFCQMVNTCVLLCCGNFRLKLDCFCTFSKGQVSENLSYIR
jgi:hypothetical protein